VKVSGVFLRKSRICLGPKALKLAPRFLISLNLMVWVSPEPVLGVSHSTFKAFMYSINDLWNGQIRASLRPIQFFLGLGSANINRAEVHRIGEIAVSSHSPAEGCDDSGLGSPE
jgi:hypothetical protein